MSDLPTGTVTFLFTDIEGSTRLWQEHTEAMPAVLTRHDALLKQVIEEHQGVVFRRVGDAVYSAFTRALDGLEAAVDAQRRLRDESWEEVGSLRVRMALHTGAAEVRDGDYDGHTLNRVARILSAGHGGQILLSDVTQQLSSDQLSDDVSLRDLGEHNLKDLKRAEHLFQVVTPDLPTDFLPLITRDVVLTNLPQEPTPFIGRQHDIQAVVEILRSSNYRLVTLTGPGGTGKTRLAIRVGMTIQGQVRDGVVFVPLAPLHDPALVASAVAGAMGLQEVSGQPWEETLRRFVRDKQLLVILDNFEHVLDATPLVAELLESPGLKILVTSRSVLRLSAEHEYAVPPLRAPDPRRLPEIALLPRYDAVALFVQRAQAVKPDFAITEENAPAVAAICHRLDGLPLAIELAAARVRLFPPQALLRRLETRLQILTGGARDLPARQQTLRGAIDWSYSLLDREEQTLFARLSAFAGGFTLEAAEIVCNPNADLGIDVLDGVQSLLEKSLLRQEGEVEPRVRMLGTIREYAAERLQDDPEVDAATRRAHAMYFTDLAYQQGKQITVDSSNAALDTLAVESENLRAAWQYWIAQRDLEQLHRLLDSLWLLYDSRGWYRATADLISELLDILAGTPPTPERSRQELSLRTTQARALLATHGYTQEVEDAYLGALAAFGDEHEIPQLFPVLRGLASFYTYRGDTVKGAEMGRAMLHLADTQNDPGIALDAHLVLGESLMIGNDLQGGLAHLDMAIAEFQTHGRPSRRLRLGTHPAVAALSVSSLLLWLLGFPDRALDRANQAVALATELEHPFTLAYGLFHAGFLHMWRREPERVRDRAIGVLDVADEHDLTIWRAVGTCLLGSAKTSLGASDEGLTDIREGIELYQGLRTPPMFWPLLRYLQAQGCAQVGQAEEGLGLIDEAIGVAGTEFMIAPEFFRMKGELLLRQSEASRSSAEALFLRAYQRSSVLDTRMVQLRAAISLCRAQREQGDADQGVKLLGTVSASFTEGFATPDLLEAQDLLHPDARESVAG